MTVNSASHLDDTSAKAAKKRRWQSRRDAWAKSPHDNVQDSDVATKQDAGKEKLLDKTEADIIIVSGGGSLFGDFLDTADRSSDVVRVEKALAGVLATFDAKWH